MTLCARIRALFLPHLTAQAQYNSLSNGGRAHPERVNQIMSTLLPR